MQPVVTAVYGKGRTEKARRHDWFMLDREALAAGILWNTHMYINVIYIEKLIFELISKD